MKHGKFLLMAFLWLGWLVVPVTQGANHPPGTGDSSPLASEADQGDLLKLDLRVYVAAKPIYCILVEKDRQRLRVLRHDGRLQVVAEYATGTGEGSGSKEKEGDSKTPEGVYFITKTYQDRKVSVFGTRAYHLNYPNYFDLRAGRDGYGIFIHGTNKPLRSNSSNGCVTLNNSDLESLADFLSVGTPVFIVSSLSAVAEGKAGYPDLGGHNFAGAKALLLPEVASQADFASLYLIRIHGQTVVVGEYWADQGFVQSPLPGPTAPPHLTVAYLQGVEDNRWAVVDRGPTLSGAGEQQGVPIAGLSLEQVEPRTSREVEGAIEEIDQSLPWQVTQEELYLSWRREANLSGELLLAAVPEQGDGSLPALSAKSEDLGVGAGKVFLIFAIATGISLGSAWVFMRRQIRRHAAGSLLAAGFAGGVDEDGQCGAEQVTRLRDEVKQAMGALHTVQRRIDKEAINVESLEELQTRMDALEVTSYDKHAALDRLSAEQAALSAQGMAECSGQVEALTVLQRELTAVKEGMSDVRQAMESAASREGALHADLAELRLLAERDEASNNGVQMPEFVAVCDSLRGEVQLMAEALRGSELSFRQAGIELSHRLEVGAAGQMSGEVVEVLQAYAAELKGLHAEMADIKGAVATSGLEPVLQELRSDLRQEQAANFELTSQVGRLHVLEEELAKRNLATQALRQEGEESRLRTQAEKMALEMTIVSLRQELSAMGETKCELGTRLGRLAALEAELGVRNQERDVLQQELREERDGKVDLLNRLVRMGELEEELASRKREGEALQEDSAERQVEVEREKRSLESALASLQNELQDERSSQAELLTRIGRIGEVEEELAGQRRAVESLRQAKEQAAGDAVAEKSRLEANLAEVVLARQVEVTSLNLALQEARNRALAEQEAVLALTGQVESLQASLRQLNEQQAQEQEGAEADLRHEVVTLKAKVAELQKKALAPDGVVLRKGSHSLPADVLRKWMAKDS